jgi:inorganic triphosphatase YgiF
MSAMSEKIAQAREHSASAGLHEVEAHSLVFFSDRAAAKKEIQLAIDHHRRAINLLVSALPDAVDEMTRKTTPAHQDTPPPLMAGD